MWVDRGRQATNSTAGPQDRALRLPARPLGSWPRPTNREARPTELPRRPRGDLPVRAQRWRARTISLVKGPGQASEDRSTSVGLKNRFRLRRLGRLQSRFVELELLLGALGSAELARLKHREQTNAVVAKETLRSLLAVDEHHRHVYDRAGFASLADGFQH